MQKLVNPNRIEPVQPTFKPIIKGNPKTELHSSQSFSSQPPPSPKCLSRCPSPNCLSILHNSQFFPNSLIIFWFSSRCYASWQLVSTPDPIPSSLGTSILNLSFYLSLFSCKLFHAMSFTKGQGFELVNLFFPCRNLVSLIHQLIW